MRPGKRNSCFPKKEKEKGDSKRESQPMKKQVERFRASRKRKEHSIFVGVYCWTDEGKASTAAHGGVPVV